MTDPVTGRKIQRSKSTGLKVHGKNKRKAEEKMREILHVWETELSNGRTFSGINPKFSVCIANWLASKEQTVRPNTLASYRVYTDSYIIPMLGEIRIGEMTRQHLQAYINMLAKTLSASTLKKHRVIIDGAINDAVLDGHISKDKAYALTNVSWPRAKHYEAKILTESQVLDLLTRVGNEPEPIRTAMLLGVCYGLRRSEIAGLRWQDIDLDNATMHICNTVTDYAGKICESETTKSRASNRIICLVDDTVTHLRYLREWQLSGGMHTNKVCADKNGKSVTPAYLSRRVSDTLKRYGYGNVRLHDLRHTATSILAKRVPIKQVQAMLGHEDVQTTLSIYTHIVSEDKRATAYALSDFIHSA